MAREGSVTRGARQLHLSQSAVSHQLVDLERDLGVRLFDRVGKRMVPTHAGRSLLESAERILSDVARAERELLVLGGAARIPFRVGSCCAMLHWFPAVLPRFERAFPRIDVRIALDAAQDTTSALAGDTIDLALTSAPPGGRVYARAKLWNEEVVAFVRPGDPIAAGARRPRGSLRRDELAGRQVLVHHIPEMDLAMLRAAVERRQGTGPAAKGTHGRVSCVPVTEILVDLVRAGVGLGLAASSIVAPYVKRGELTTLPLAPPVRRTLWAVWRRSNPRALPVADLVDMAREELQRGRTRPRE